MLTLFCVVLSVLLPHPALPPTMQALIIRLLLSLSYSLETRSPAVISSADLVLHERITRAVEEVLSKAVKLRGVGGSVGPWAGLVVDRPVSYMITLYHKSLIFLALRRPAMTLQRRSPPLFTRFFHLFLGRYRQ